MQTRYLFMTSILAACLGMAGCGDESGDTSKTCPDGQVMNSDTKQCEPGTVETTCTTDADCGEGKVCKSGVCETSSDPECMSDADCEDGKACVEGVCKPSSEEKPCAADEDCEDGNVCAEGVCKPSSEEKPCAADEDCEDGKACVEGVCKPSSEEKTCAADEDCEDGNVCVEGVCKPSSEEKTCAADEDCEDGKVCSEGSCIIDEVIDVVPCVITKLAPYEQLKAGVGSASYQTYSDATAGSYKLLKNGDGSINICQIGYVKENKCFPIYTPREYDFYGDGIDANCDGADYDTNHTVFVSQKENIENGAKTFLTINKAMAAAKDSDKNFYHDIVVETGVYSVTSEEMDVQKSPIRVPVSEPSNIVAKFYNFDASKLPNKAGMVKDGKIISAYGLHSQLAINMIKNAEFDPNKYLFSYYDEKCDDAGVCKYEKAAQTERNQPDGLIRIYGGFQRKTVEKAVLTAEHDLWQIDKEVPTQVDWVVDDFYTSNVKDPRMVYSLVSPESGKYPLSLAMMNFSLNMSPKVNFTLPVGFADGVTFIGIDGTVGGVKELLLTDTTIKVVGIAGYSYPEFNASNELSHAMNGTNGAMAGSNAVRDEHNVTADNNDYIIIYDNNAFNKDKDYLCGYEWTANALTQSLGGIGGYGKSYQGGHYRDKLDGRPSLASRDRLGNTINQSQSSGGSGVFFDESCDLDTACSNERDNYRGENGVGGANGENGASKNTIMGFTETSEGLWVRSDRTKSKGKYGLPGVGGGGGAVFRCWMGKGSDHTQCYAASGGAGGCGGEGGFAGGTGGSAIGIAVRSSGKGADSSRIEFNHSADKDAIAVYNGSGGRAQAGGLGGDGANGGEALLYAREGAFGGDTQCQRLASGGAGGAGGGGGAGAGGKAGWAYPIVAICPRSFGVSSDKFVDSKSLGNCGFTFSDHLIKKPGDYASQYLNGLTMRDTAYGQKSGNGGTRKKNILRASSTKTCGVAAGGKTGTVDIPMTVGDADRTCLNPVTGEPQIIYMAVIE